MNVGISDPRPRGFEPSTIGIVGTGVMGRGIAQILAQAGHRLCLFDAQAGGAARAIETLRGTWQMLASKGRIDAKQADANVARLTAADTLESMKDCDIVIEAIVEDLAVKRELFSRLEAVVSERAILATNTSSLSVTAIAAGARQPDRIAGLHFFNPVPLMRIVEVIGGVRTSPRVLDVLDALIAPTGHRAVRAKDTPGFLVNHAGRAYGTEALMIAAEGVADFTEIDLILREQVAFDPGSGKTAGFRLGPFELLDVTGLDVSQPVMESIFHQYYGEPRFRPSVIGAQRQTAGLLGRKTGEGFYRYADGVPVPPEPAAAASGSKGIGASAGAGASGPLRASVVPVSDEAGDVRTAERLAAQLSRLNCRATLERSASADFILIAPLGEDASSAAARLGLPPARTVAIDTLFDPFAAGVRRRSLMRTVATDPGVLAAATRTLTSDGCAVSHLQDSNGFVAQRVIAMIVSIATEIAQQGIALPVDIDAAVTAGLGYPLGPLAMGDALGPRRILQLLQAMHEATGDPRYRPGPWLRRRAALGLSLLHP